MNISRFRKCFTKLLFVTLTIVIIMSCANNAQSAGNDMNQKSAISCDSTYVVQIKNAADYIVRYQKTDGAIPDAWDSQYFNTDNNMHYAMLGLYHAYKATNDEQYLAAIRKGLSWLADIQDNDGKWHWRYVADDDGDYVPSAGEGMDAVETIDAIQAFFAYNLWLYSLAGGNSDFVDANKSIAKKGIDKLIQDNLDEDGVFFYSSWRTPKDGERKVLPIKYAMGQGDIYLGLIGACNLLSEEKYCELANALREKFDEFFWDEENSRYAIGIGRSNSVNRQEYMNAQSYPTLFFKSESLFARNALDYLKTRVVFNGPLIMSESNEIASTTAVAGMASAANLLDNKTAYQKAISYILSMQIQNERKTNGAVKFNPSFSDDNLSNLYINVTGLSIVSLCGNILPR